MMENSSVKRVLVCPLNWGIGHATRCVPVIRMLINKGFQVIVASEGYPLHFLQYEFPELEFYEFPGFSPTYPKNGNMVLRMLASAPFFLAGILQEHHQLKKLVKELNINLVISDNRYGLWHRQVRSIFIIHQVMIKTPNWLRFAEPILYFVNRLMINRFDECWIPDMAGNENLSGDLSHKYPLPRNAVFIGRLSRFRFGIENRQRDGALVVLLSGPEPQRTILEEKLVNQLLAAKLPCTIISGKPGSGEVVKAIDNVRIVPHLPTVELEKLLHSVSLIICRPGYSTIMDLVATGAKALFIPTPGQTEQEYLAELHQNRGTFCFVKQQDLNLLRDIEKALGYKGICIDGQPDLLVNCIEALRKHLGMLT